MCQEYKKCLVFCCYQKILLMVMLLIFCTSAFGAQRATKISDFITQNKDVSQPQIVYNNYKKIKTTNSREKKILNVVRKVVQAEIYSNKLDRISDESVSLYLDALNEAKHINDPGLLIYVNTEFGFFYYTFNEYIKATPYFNVVENLLEKTPDNRLIEASSVFKKNAYFYTTLGQHDKSIGYLKKALKHTDINSHEYGAILNNIGSGYYKKNDAATAEKYFLKSQSVSLKNNDRVRYAKVLGDLALLYSDKGAYEHAISLLLEDIAISLAEKSDRNTMYARILLSKIYVKNNQFRAAKETLQLASAYIDNKEYLNSFGYEIAEVKLRIALQTNDAILELEARRTLDSLGKKIANSDGEQAIKLANWEAERSKYNTAIANEKSKVDQANLVNWIIGFFMIALIIVVVFIIFMIKRNYKKALAKHENFIHNHKEDQLQVQKKLNDSSETLNSYQSYLRNQDEKLNLLEKELVNIQKNNSNRTDASYLIDEIMDTSIMSDLQWQQLLQTFTKEDHLYYNYLQSNFSELSDTMFKILTMNKIGMNKAEISFYMNMKIDTLDEVLQLLRIKYNGAFDEPFQS